MRFPALLLLVTAVSLGACGGKVFVDANGGAAGATGGGGGGLVCSPAGAQDIPVDERICAVDSDCTIQVVVDCCTLYPVGVASAQLGAFQAYQDVCHPMPGLPCECPVNTATTVTDDGKITSGNVSDQAMVACQSGRCGTFMP